MNHLDSMAANSNQLTIQFLEQLLKLYGDTMNSLSKQNNMRFMDDTEHALQALISHQADGGKIMVHTTSKDSLSIIEELAKKYHIPVTTLSCKENNEEKKVIAYRDKDKPVMNRILREYQMLLSPGIGEMDSFSFNQCYEKDNVTELHNINYELLQAFKMEAGLRDFKYTVKEEYEGGKSQYKICYPSEMEETASVILQNSLYDIHGKEEVLKKYESQKTEIIKNIRSNKEIIIADSTNPNHFFFLKNDSNMTPYELTEYHLKLSNDKINCHVPKDCKQCGEKKIISEVSLLNNPLILSPKDFPLMEFITNYHDTEKYIQALDECKKEYAINPNILDGLCPWREEYILTYRYALNMEQELLNRTKDMTAELQDGFLAFPQSEKEQILEIYDEIIYHNLSKEERIALKLELEGRISNNLKQIDFHNIKEPFYITNANQSGIKSTALLFEEDKVTIYWQGKEQGVFLKDSPDYEKAFELIQVLSDPVCLTKAEGDRTNGNITMHDSSPLYKSLLEKNPAKERILKKKPDIENKLQSIRKEVTTPHDRKMRKEMQREEEERELYEQRMRRWKSKDDMER